MLSVAVEKPMYIIIDALDECPDATETMPTEREVLLDLLAELVGTRRLNLRICVTSRPEIDIRRAIEALTHSAVSLHDESGQQEDICSYVRKVVHSDAKMWSWRNDEKELVIEELSNKADGM